MVASAPVRTIAMETCGGKQITKGLNIHEHEPGNQTINIFLDSLLTIS